MSREHNAQRCAIERETRLQRAVTVFIATGIFFMLLPGTFLGVWNLISISSRHDLERLSPAWLQAHGHAQIYGWIGTFILGIGFYSLSKMGRLPPFAVRRAWLCWALWTSGVAIRWTATITAWHWRIGLPVSALLELAGFLIFFSTVTRHKADSGAPRQPRPPWMLVVVGSTFGFLVSLILNAFAVFNIALKASEPAIAPGLDQRLLVVPIWGFLVPTVWGFNARWLPVFLGLRAPGGRRLIAALGTAWAAVIAMLLRYPLAAVILFLAAVATAISALHIFEPSEKPAKTEGVHASFPVFVRLAWVWLVIAACLSVWAALSDQMGGIWGASRHALTVGFLASMVFAIGQRILPAFCGARVLFSKQIMLWSLLLLNAGCFLRVFSEIPAYEGFAHTQLFWKILPVSAVTELAAVTLFAANLLVTFRRPPAHLARGAGRQSVSETTHPAVAPLR